MNGIFYCFLHALKVDCIISYFLVTSEADPAYCNGNLNMGLKFEKGTGNLSRSLKSLPRDEPCIVLCSYVAEIIDSTDCCV